MARKGTPGTNFTPGRPKKTPAPPKPKKPPVVLSPELQAEKERILALPGGEEMLTSMAAAAMGEVSGKARQLNTAVKKVAEAEVAAAMAAALEGGGAAGGDEGVIYISSSSSSSEEEDLPDNKRLKPSTLAGCLRAANTPLSAAEAAAIRGANTPADAANTLAITPAEPNTAAKREAKNLETSGAGPPIRQFRSKVEQTFTNEFEDEEGEMVKETFTLSVLVYFTSGKVAALHALIEEEEMKTTFVRKVLNMPCMCEAFKFACTGTFPTCVCLCERSLYVPYLCLPVRTFPVRSQYVSIKLNVPMLCAFPQRPRRWSTTTTRSSRRTSSTSPRPSSSR